MKILVIRFSSIGDMVLTTPVIRCLKKQLPETELHYLTKPAYREVLAYNPYIDKLHFLQENSSRMITALEEESFDLVIDLHHNLRTFRIKHALAVQSYSFPKLNVEKWLVVNFKSYRRLPDISIVDRYLETVKPLGVANDGAGLDYFISPNDRVSEKDIPAAHLAGYIAVVIGGAHATKCMPVEMLKELCEKIDRPLILLGGKEDREKGAAIAETDPVKIYNACGKFSLNESADLVRRSKLVITHDTGLMHIAAAFGKEVISIWGNTIPEFGMYPYYGDNNLQSNPSPLFDIVENKGLRCRPCSKIGYDKCPRVHFKCMRELDTDKITAMAEERWLHQSS